MLDAHGSEDGWCNVSEDTRFLSETPALGGVGHDEGNLVGGVGCLGGALFVEHLLSVSARWSG